jgi:hypothetical protein
LVAELEHVMKRIIPSMASVAAVIVVSVLVADEPKGPSSRTSDRAAITCELFKHEYTQAARTSFWLDITAERPRITVTAICDLRYEGHGIGRFPLRQTGSTKEDSPLRFRVQCLVDDFVTDSVIHVNVRDDATGKGISLITVKLRDAIMPDRSRNAK